MSTDLYRQYAHYYEVIAKDRDFTKQFELITSLLPKNNSRVGACVLELFAGPAYHSIIASQNYGYEVWAIDSSQEMKNIALSRGFLDSQNYIVNALPDAISDLPRERKIDCVICLRYSLSYLGIKEVFQLMNDLKERLNKGGKIFIELHEISSIINCMRSTDIHLRKGRSNRHEEVECLWPAGDIAWKRESYVAEMNISLQIRSAFGETREATFVSKENIHSAELLEFLAGLCGLRYALVTDKYNPEYVETYFKHSVLIELTNDNSIL